MIKTITLEWAISKKVCEEGLEDFKKAFGERTETGVPTEEVIAYLPQHALWIADAVSYTGILYDKDGDKYHFKNGLFYREDGPAVEYSDGRKEWWLNDYCYQRNY